MVDVGQACGTGDGGRGGGRVSEQTMRTCPSCGLEGEMRGRSVVICDQCGIQADKRHCPYRRGLASPEGWSGGFYETDAPVRKGYAPVISVDFCSEVCRWVYEQTHKRAMVIA